ncbi:hypothetical protein T492DRAFT_883510 [Pavlovales sp. CCMP2436]|nr:hypothetical protein T492DRAFT_883510 [Pavlovales sp. CCMP2436]
MASGGHTHGRAAISDESDDDAQDVTNAQLMIHVALLVLLLVLLFFLSILGEGGRVHVHVMEDVAMGWIRWSLVLVEVLLVGLFSRTVALAATRWTKNPMAHVVLLNQEGPI